MQNDNIQNDNIQNDNIQNVKDELGLFYDNSAFNLENCEEINGLCSIKVFETDEEEQTCGWRDNRKHYLNIIKSQEQYPYIMDVLDECEFLKDDMVDHLSGINDKHMDAIMNLIRSQEVNIKFVILDFDRTLTKIEGILDSKDLLEQIPPEVVAKYYFGGVDRLDKLHYLFDFLHRREIDLYILTNNEGLDYIYKILKVAKLIKEPLKFIYYNCELRDNLPNKIETIKKKLSTIPKYRKVFNNNIPEDRKLRIVKYLETEDNSENGDSKFK